MFDTKTPTVYYGHPIAGAKGSAATLEYVQFNSRAAIDTIKFLRNWYPEVQWYCPAEYDMPLQILHRAGKLPISEILWADCEIIRRHCHGYLGHLWEPSSGVEVEKAAAIDVLMPTLIVETMADFAEVADTFLEKVRVYHKYHTQCS